jgi:hypothetical protein
MGTKSAPARPSALLPYGWEWFDVRGAGEGGDRSREAPGAPSAVDWNWGARSTEHHSQSCQLSLDRTGMVRSDETSLRTLLAASIVWRAYSNANRATVLSFGYPHSSSTVRRN